MTEFDNCKFPLVGVEYVVNCKSIDTLVCVLCNKKGDLKNILNHLTSRKHQLLFLTQHFETFAKQISVIKFDIKKSLYLVSHLIENKFGRRSITICECGHSSHDKTSYAHFYAQDDLKVGRIVNFLHEYEKNKIDSPKIREGDFYSNNNKYTSKRNSKLSNYYHLIKYAFETLDVKYHFYKQYPSDHPEYAGAWTAYSTAYSTERLSRDRKIPLKKFSIHDFKAGFKKHWKILFDESFIREKKNMVQEIRLQMNLPLDKEENSSLVATEHKNKLPEKIKLAPKRNIIEKKEVTGKRIKISPVEKMPTLEVVKIPEQSDPMNLLSICRKLKGCVLGDLTVKISKLFHEASKSCNENNLNLLQDIKNVKLLENVKLILIDQTVDNLLPATKTNEMKEMIEHITILLMKVELKLTEQSNPYLSEDDIKILVLNYSELTSKDQNDLVNYLEIMKLKNQELYDKITKIVKEEITLDSKEDNSVVVKVNDNSILISDDDDDYDLTEVVIKAKLNVDEDSCEIVEMVTEEDIIFEISSDEY